MAPKWLSFLALQAGFLLLVASGPAAASDPQYPSSGQPWTKAEYLAFNGFRFATNQALPHLRNAEGRALFKRLIDRDNIRLLLADGRSDRDHSNDLRIILSNMGAVRASYYLALKSGEPLSEELAQVEAFNVELAAIVAALMGDDAAQLACSSSLKTTYLGAVDSMAEQDVHTPAQIVSLAETVRLRYPVFAPLLSENEGVALRHRISSLQQGATDPDLRAALGRLLGELMPRGSSL